MNRYPHEYENPACRTNIGDPSLWVEETRENLPKAINICRSCDHVIECAEYGVKHEVVGVWGALTTSQRADLASKAGIRRLPIITLIASRSIGNQ